MARLQGGHVVLKALKFEGEPLVIACGLKGRNQSLVEAKGFEGVSDSIGHVCLSRMTTDASSRQAVQRASSARMLRAGNGRRPACTDDV